MFILIFLNLIENTNIREHPPINKKIKMVNYTPKNLIHQTSKEFEVKRKTIRNWIQNLAKSIATENKPKKFKVHSG